MSTETKPERAWIPNLIVFVVITASMLAFPVRNLLKQTRDPHRLAVVRGRVLAQAFDKIAVTNRESAIGILRCVDPALGLSTLPGLPDENGHPMIAWNVVDLPPEAPRNMPMLISRNLRADSLASLTGRVSDLIVDEPPFGTNLVLVIFRSGHPATIQGDSLQGTWLQYLGPVQPTNRIFRP